MNRVQSEEMPITDQLAKAASLPRDLALIKIENETIMSAAAAHPRDYKAIVLDIKNQLQAFKSFAQAAIYKKPVGKDDSGKMKYARGLSIRAAEALACSYKYNRVSSNIEHVDDDRVKVIATFVDYQCGKVWSADTIVSKVYRASGGGMRRHNDDRFFNVVVKAEVSKCIREVILRSVPPGMRHELEEIAEEQLTLFLTPEDQKKAIEYFTTRGVTEEQLVNAIGKKKESWTQDDRRTLWQIWTAIEEGETTIEEAFGGESKPGASGTNGVERPKRKAPTTEPAVQPGAAADAEPTRDPEPPDPIATLTSLTELIAAMEPEPLHRGCIIKTVFNGRVDLENIDTATLVWGLSILELTNEEYTKMRPAKVTDREKLVKAIMKESPR